MSPTHEVTNQPPPLGDIDLWSADPILSRAVDTHGAGWATNHLAGFGLRAGTVETRQLARDANRHAPELITHDRFGNRVDRVDFHPAWHSLMGRAVGAGVHSLGWTEDRRGSQVARTALMYLDSQIEQGHGCPISMTSSVIPSLRMNTSLAEAWEPRLMSTAYDPTFGPVETKTGALMGMGMTEKQGGSDVRSNTTEALPASEGHHLLTGHKWFTSAPMCDAFLVLAQAPRGLSCFFVPRFLTDGSKNRVFLQRLKDKVGNRSNASAEVEFDQTSGWLVGEEGRGVRTIIEMVAGTRLDCVTGSAAIMRQSLMSAAWHVSHREAFGRTLIDQPAMINVIADLELETESATLMMLRVAASFDESADEREAMLKRIATPIAKYWVTKRTTAVVREAMECLGGNGYVEDSELPRWFRESPVNGIWEGSGNVIALDVLRAVRREPGVLDVLMDEIDLGDSHAAHSLAEQAIRTISDTTTPESDARRITEMLAIALSSSLMHRSTDHGDLFDAGRIDDPFALFGTLPASDDLRNLAERAVPTP